MGPDKKTAMKPVQESPWRLSPFVFAMKTRDVLIEKPMAVVLSASEEDTAARFLLAADQQRYRAAKILLRLVLQAATGKAAKSFVFGRRENGKPCLFHEPDLDFNVSHAGDWIAAALAPRKDCIGVDIECDRPRDFWLDIAPVFLSPTERETVGEETSSRGFLSLWTAKEAALKALGTGFARPPDTLDIISGTVREATAPKEGLFGRWLWLDERHCLCAFTSSRQRCRILRLRSLDGLERVQRRR